MTTRVLFDRILIEPVEERLSAQIIVPEEIAHAINPPQIGKVIAIGEDVKFTKIGDQVLHGKHAGMETKIKGRLSRILREKEDVMAIVE